MNPSPVVNWTYPAPRGWLDRFVGPGATRAELAVQFVPTLAASATLVALAVVEGWGWTTIQLVVAAVLTIDLVGGVLTNATGAAKRWYHRAGQTARHHLSFVAVHIHPFILVGVFGLAGSVDGSMAWIEATIAYLFLVVGAAVVVATPLYLRRPVASLLTMIGMVSSLTWFPAPDVLSWMLPALYLKIFVCHLVREEPYRPEVSSRESDEPKSTPRPDINLGASR